MIETLLKEIEKFVGSDDFEYEMEERMYKIEAEGAGKEIIESLFGIIERHPIDDFGMPGAMVHFIEKYYPEYLPSLVASIKRKPALHTIFMLNRCINVSESEHKDDYIDILKEVAENDNVDMCIRESAQSFVDYQLNK